VRSGGEDSVGHHLSVPVVITLMPLLSLCCWLGVVVVVVVVSGRVGVCLVVVLLFRVVPVVVATHNSLFLKLKNLLHTNNYL